MTKFSIGDRVRLSPKADPNRRVALGDMHGTIGEVHSSHYRVDWDAPNPDWNGPEHYEIELAPALSLVVDLRAKAATKRAEAQQAQKETDVADAAYEEALFRTHALSREADALEAAAKILEEAE